MGDIGKTVGGGCLVLIAIPILLVGLLEFKMRPLHEPPFLVDVTVEMTVNGEQVRIEKTVECRTFAVPAGEFLGRMWRRAPTRYAPSIGAFGARLRDGSTVMLWNPYRCARKFSGEAGGQDSWDVYDPPEIAKPIIGWVPPGDAPATMEFYYRSLSFDRPSSRIKDVRFSVKKSAPQAVPNSPDEFDWFTSHRLYRGEKREPAGRYVAILGTAIDREQIKQYDSVLHTELGGYSVPTVLSDRVMSNGVAERSAAQTLFETVIGSAGLPRQWRYDPFGGYGYEDRPYQTALYSGEDGFATHAFNILPTDRAYNVKRSVTGDLAVLYRVSERNWFTKLPPLAVPYQVHGTLILPNIPVALRGGRDIHIHRSNMVYDPATETLFRISALPIDLLALSSHARN